MDVADEAIELPIDGVIFEFRGRLQQDYLDELIRFCKELLWSLRRKAWRSQNNTVAIPFNWRASGSPIPKIGL